MPTAFIAFLMVFQSTLPARGATSHRAVRAGLGIQFQSTLPARGATFSLPSMACWMMYFNPRSPHGERPPF